MNHTTCSCTAHPIVKANIGDALAAAPTEVTPAHHARSKKKTEKAEISGEPGKPQAEQSAPPAAKSVVSDIAAIRDSYGLAARLPADVEAFSSSFRLGELWDTDPAAARRAAAPGPLSSRSRPMAAHGLRANTANSAHRADHACRVLRLPPYTPRGIAPLHACARARSCAVHSSLS